jgi:hypothetical protein
MRLLVITTGAMLVFEIVRVNVPHVWQTHLPWRIELLNAPTAATLFLFVLLAGIAREEHAGTRMAALEVESGFEKSPERLVTGRNADEEFWQARIRNCGPGTGVITALRWKVRADREAPYIELPEIELLHSQLGNFHLRSDDYAIDNFSVGTVFVPGCERLYFECTRLALTQLAELIVVVDVTSELGEKTVRALPLLPQKGAFAPALRPQESAPHLRDKG